MTLAPMLKEDGKLIGDFTVANVPDRFGEEYFLFGSGVAEEYHLRWFEKHLPKNGSVRVEALGLACAAFRSPGRTRAHCSQKVTHADMSPEAFPFMAIRNMDIGQAPCLVGRVSYTGDLGYEIWMPLEYLRHVFDR